MTRDMHDNLISLTCIGGDRTDTTYSDSNFSHGREMPYIDSILEIDEKKPSSGFRVCAADKLR
jgi:hypothetical protein